MGERQGEEPSEDHGSSSVPPLPEAPARVAAPTNPVVESDADRALRIALESRRGIGTPPNEVRGDKGSGLWLAIAWIRTRLDVLFVAASAETAARAARDEWTKWALRLAIGFLILSGLGALVAYLTGFHR